MSQAEDFARKTESIFNELNMALEQSKAKMTEDVFLNFLPLFCGELPVNEKITIAVYHSYVGSPYREAAVYDASGKFLFDVPPTVMHAPIDVKRERGQDSFNNVMATARLHNEYRQGNGDAVIIAGVHERINPDMQDFTQLLDYLRRWNAIFERYNKPLIELPGTAKAAQENSAAIVENNDDWEPL